MLKVGELANAAGVSKRTIDYYTNLGLLDAQRSSSNYRLFDENHVERVRLIQHLKAQKFSLKEIQQQLALIKGNDYSTVNEVVQKVNEICKEMEKLDCEFQALKPYFDKFNQEELAVLKQHIHTRGLSLAQTLLIFFG